MLRSENKGHPEKRAGKVTRCLKNSDLLKKGLRCKTVKNVKVNTVVAVGLFCEPIFDPGAHGQNRNDPICRLSEISQIRSEFLLDGARKPGLKI